MTKPSRFCLLPVLSCIFLLDIPKWFYTLKMLMPPVDFTLTAIKYIAIEQFDSHDSSLPQV